jgi:hypothetical protein
MIDKRKLEIFSKKYVDMIERSEDGLVEQCIKVGAEWQKEQTSNSIEQVIKDICKDNSHLLDTPEIQEIIKYFKINKNETRKLLTS